MSGASGARALGPNRSQRGAGPSRAELRATGPSHARSAREVTTGSGLSGRRTAAGSVEHPSDSHLKRAAINATPLADHPSCDTFEDDDRLVAVRSAGRSTRDLDEPMRRKGP